jgi:Asp-tRNA(Asn)/Glu-tRNA(Gln) amidotransferase A subunit family amidase
VTIAPATGLAALGAVQAAQRLSDGSLTARDYALALLARVEEVEAEVQAWTRLDTGYLLAQADAADRAHRAGARLGALHGLPVGVKDIIDTARLPTENGTVLHEGRQPADDAVVVARLQAAGGLVMGKTVTTELATYFPGKTRNPHNTAHTPGGSSSGSAAAVAAGMAPLAIGTQTNGSVIRPASFCGVVGYKPTAGWLPGAGVLRQSPALDQLGAFARTVDDVALLAQSLCLRDLGEPLAHQREPVLGFARTPMWPRVAPDAQAAFTGFVQGLRGFVVDLELPARTGAAIDWHRALMEAEISASFEAEYERGRDRLSASLRAQIERGRAVTEGDRRRAMDERAALGEAFDGLFDSVDAILTPATLGTAPAGLDATGDPVMCTLWTFTGHPAITLPLLKGADGLPIGVQLVGRRDGDAGLLCIARWLSRTAPPAT